MVRDRAAVVAVLVALAGARASAAENASERAAALIARAEKAAAEIAPSDACLPEPFSRAAAERLKAGDPEMTALMSSGTAGGDLLMAYVCRAVAAGSPAPCGGLKDIAIVPTFDQMPSKAATHTFEFRCRANYSNVLMSKAALSRDRSLSRLCLDNETGHPVFLPGKAAEGCRILGEAFSDPAVCGRLAPLLDAGATGCVESARQLTGDAAYCPAVADKMNRELCLGAAAYRRARADGPGACGDSPVCRMMTSPGASVCAVYEERLRRGVCPLLGAAERARRTAELGRMLDEARGLLESGTPVLDRAGAARLDALSERGARLRARLGPAADPPGPGDVPTP